ncbi:MAG: hypothetical protein JXB32_13145 [Deltaproteobacteria bacterium]|nr:hypothetical protein [Deltaproteobacteria bacterium]
MRRGRPRAGWAAAVVLGAAWTASAQAQRVEGTILQIDQNELLVDLGRVDGVSPDDPVRLYRRIVVEHPVTHRRLEDRFPLGDETLAEVAERMSIIVLDTPPAHAPKVGDTVVVTGAGSPAAQPPAPAEQETAACPACPATDGPATATCELDPEVRTLVQTFGRTLGQTLERRIEIWESYLATNRDVSWAGPVAADVEALRGALRTMRGDAPATAVAPRARAGHEPPTQAFVGEPLQLVVAVDPRDALRLAQLHVRREGERGYEVFDLEPDGDFYLRGRVPDEFVQPDGFAYFLVGIDAGGTEVPLGGSAGRPVQVPVVERLGAPPVRTDRSNLHTSFEYVDFLADELHRDYYLRFEADFRYVLSSWFYGLRMGFGVFEGLGGPVDAVDWSGDDETRADPQPISYRYGFTEVEFRLHELFYVIGRISVGSARAYETSDGRSEAPEALVGGGGRVRIGRPTGTNLELGGGYIEDLGYEANLSVNLGLVENVPLRGYIIVTDMPVRGDLGVRLVAEAGWQPVSWFEFTVLAGYNIRTIHHQGFSLGLGASFLW